jgi:hypothetical protein
MRRTARLRALSLVLPSLGITLGVAAPSAFADPAAEVSPSSVQPGGNVTVSVSCDPGTGTPPATVDATSEAFESQTVRLQLVPGNDDQVSGPAYSGTARISADQELQNGAGGVGPDSAWTVDGTCPTVDRAAGKAWSATFTVTRGAAVGSHPPCPEPSGSCDTPVVQNPVRAGQGGTFSDSVPALVAGGLLIAGATAGAVYRLRRKAPAADV